MVRAHAVARVVAGADARAFARAVAWGMRVLSQVAARLEVSLNSGEYNGRRPHVPTSTEMIHPAVDVVVLVFVVGVVVVVVVVVFFLPCHGDMKRKLHGMFSKPFLINEYKRIWFSRYLMIDSAPN